MDAMPELEGSEGVFRLTLLDPSLILDPLCRHFAGIHHG